jgi:hypothetical protein
VEQAPIHPVMIQKLTVMKTQFADSYHQALFCGWFAALIARELLMNHAMINTAFMAGLLHDIGILHIQAFTEVSKNESLSPKQWRSIQCHSVVSKLLLEATGYKRSILPQVVFEHHERCDGTGYPTGKSGSALQPLGQVIAMVDSIHSILHTQLKPRGRNIGDTLHFLNLNPHAHFYYIYQAIYAILKKADIPSSFSVPQKDLPSYTKKMMERGHCLHRAVQELERLAQALPKCLGKRHYTHVLTKIQNVLMIVASSGMVRPELVQWLEHVATLTVEELEDTRTFSQLNDIELMQNELLWQIANAIRQMQSSISTDSQVDSPSLSNQIYHSVNSANSLIEKCKALM